MKTVVVCLRMLVVAVLAVVFFGVTFFWLMVVGDWAGSLINREPYHLSQTVGETRDFMVIVSKAGVSALAILIPICVGLIVFVVLVRLFWPKFHSESAAEPKVLLEEPETPGQSKVDLTSVSDEDLMVELLRRTRDKDGRVVTTVNLKYEPPEHPSK
jgi:hypothetical protein